MTCIQFNQYYNLAKEGLVKLMGIVGINLGSSALHTLQPPEGPARTPQITQ